MNLVEPVGELVMAVFDAKRFVVGDVVTAAHEGIHRTERVALAPWKRHKTVVEILGRRAGNVPAYGVGHVQLRSRGRELRGRTPDDSAHRSFPSAARATRASLRPFELEQLAECRRIFTVKNHSLADTKPAQVFEWEVDSSLGEVGTHVLPEIRQLQGGTSVVRKALAIVVA